MSLPSPLFRTTPINFLRRIITFIFSGAVLFSSMLLAVPIAKADTSVTVSETLVPSPHLDVPYVPTRTPVVTRMLEMAQIKPNDYLIDLGSGDGRIVVAAARDWNVSRALGIDLDPQRVAEANENAEQAGITDRVTFEQGDLFKKDFSDATVLTMYLLPTVNMRLRPIILEKMAPGTRVVSHSFDMDDWTPDQSDRVDGAMVYLWIVPARVEGRWQLENNKGKKISLTLKQRFQKVTAEALVDGVPTTVVNPILRGEEIKFTIGNDHYVGIVNGTRINSRQADDAIKDWHAQRL